MKIILKHFDELVSNGLQVIPLWENSKVPMCKGWTTWNKNQCREVLERYPEANLGLLLGQIVDVEGDSEAANNKILKIIGNYPHPCYSSTKSIHHLFINPDPKLSIFKHKDIEFRGFKHQSVLPPSSHQGIFYEWLQSFFPIPPMPDGLLNFYHSLKNKKDRKNQHRSDLIQIYCNICRRKKLINKRRFELELAVFKKLYTSWECVKCRSIDIRDFCRDIRRFC